MFLVTYIKQEHIFIIIPIILFLSFNSFTTLQDKELTGTTRTDIRTETEEPTELQPRTNRRGTGTKILLTQTHHY